MASEVVKEESVVENEEKRRDEESWRYLRRRENNGYRFAREYKSPAATKTRTKG